MSAATNLGPVVRRLRERWRLTQQEVVEYARLERSASYISSIETGKTSPTIAELEALAIVLRTTVFDMLREARGERGEEAASDPVAGQAADLYKALSPERQQTALDFLHFLTERQQRGV